MTGPESEFDDPALRAAVQRACGNEIAPPALRRRVERLFATIAVEDQLNASETPSQNPSRRLMIAMPSKLGWSAIAASLVFLFLAIEVKVLFFPSQPAPGAHVASTSFPMTIAVSMVKAHDNCAKLSDHHLLEGNDFTALAAKLTQEQGVPVFAANLGDGWTFKGAGLCESDGKRAAHLIYVKGTQTISVFTSRSSKSGGKGRSSYHRKTLQGHPIAGFVNQGAFYLVVGSSTDNSLTAQDLDPIVDQLCVALGLEKCQRPSTSKHSTTRPR